MDDLVGTVIPAAGRNPNEEHGTYHLYKYVPHVCDADCTMRVDDDRLRCREGPELLPMCIYGWNRSNGFAFSILRNNTMSARECKRCRKNVDADKQPAEPRRHYTRWI